jgi:hypothetical protein
VLLIETKVKDLTVVELHSLISDTVKETYGVIMGLEMLSLESQFSIEYQSSRKKEHGCHGFDGYARISDF